MFKFFLAAILLVVWAIISFLLPGDNYMEWYYRLFRKDYRLYDMNIFKMSHSVFFFLVGHLMAILGVLRYHGSGVWFILLGMLIIYNLIIFKFAKKKVQ